MGKARDWGDVGAEGGPGAIRRAGDDPATDIPFDTQPNASPFVNGQANGEAQPSALSIFSVASFAGKAVPVRKWLVPDVIPANQVTILSGNGGDGKSLLSLQLAVAAVTATGWIGYLPEPGGVLYASAEDDPDEIHRRIAAIIEGRDDLSLAAMAAFNVIDLSAMDALLAAPFPNAAGEDRRISVYRCANAHGIHAPAFRGGRRAIPGAAAVAAASAEGGALAANCRGKTVCRRW
jgi:hypothetical protein